MNDTHASVEEAKGDESHTLSDSDDDVEPTRQQEVEVHRGTHSRTLSGNKVDQLEVAD